MLTMMRSHLRLAGVVTGCALLVIGCSSTVQGSETESSSVVSSQPANAPISSTTVSPGPSTESSVASIPPSVETPPEVVTFVCGDLSLYQSGTAIYSDGTTGYEPSCDTYIPPTGSQDQNGDGVISGFERCGTACGEEPTSGEIQTQHGCEQGYITGPVCDVVGSPSP